MTTDASPSPTTLDAWKKSDVHEITLPSGTKVTIRPLDLEMHMMLGDTPGGLRAHVLQNLQQKMARGELSQEDMDAAQARVEEYNRGLIVQSLVEPVITDDDLASLPERDTKMILEIAMRTRDIDATGKPIGVVPLELSSALDGS